MNRAGFAKVAALVVIAAGASVYFLSARGQAPSAPTATPAPAAAPAATSPAVTPPAAPAPAASTIPSTPVPTASTPAPVTATPPATPPTAAETPAATPPAAPASPPVPDTPPAKAETPAAPPKTANADPFGEEQTLTPRKVVMLKGEANWDSAFDTLVGSLKTLTGFIDKQGIKPAGNVLIVYNSTDDTGFTYQAEIPVDQDVKNLAKGMSMGLSPDGKVLKFVHRGSYDNMDNTYEAITNHLDDKKLEAKDAFIEEYVTDPLKTAEDKLVINVFVPLK